MSERVTLTIPDLHYNWLIEVQKRRGWDNVQDAIRSVIEDAFRFDSKLGRKMDEPVSIKVGGAQITATS